MAQRNKSRGLASKPQASRVASDAETAKTTEQRRATDAEIARQSKRVGLYATEYSIELLAHKMSRGELVVPNYQPKCNWDGPRQSRFVESLLVGFPIPSLTFWEMSDGRLEIVDGTQRIITLNRFILGGLQLGRLEILPAVSGFTFSELPESRQLKLRNRSIRGTVLSEHADEQARFEIFQRLNPGRKRTRDNEVSA